MNRAAFLDRDGVLNDSIDRNGKACAPLTLEEYRIFEDVGRQVSRLKEAGLLCIVFTNQPEVSRGLLSMETLTTMHQKLRSVAPLDDIFVCPHQRSEGCACCKPAPGMLLEAAKKWNVDLKESFVVGDRGFDIGAGQAVGAATVLIDRPYSDCSAVDARVADLGGAVDVILKWIREKREVRT